MSVNTYNGANDGDFSLRSNWSSRSREWNRECAITSKFGVVLDAGAAIGKIGTLTLTDSELHLTDTAGTGNAIDIGNIVLAGSSTLVLGTIGSPSVLVRTGPVSCAGASVLIVTGGSTLRTRGQTIEVVQYGALIAVHGTIDVTSGTYNGTIHGSGLSTITLDNATIAGNLNSGGSLRVQDLYAAKVSDATKRSSTVSGDLHTGLLFAVNVRPGSSASLAVAGYAYLASIPMPIEIGAPSDASYSILSSTLGMTVDRGTVNIGTAIYGVNTNATPPHTLQFSQAGQANNTPLAPPPVPSPVDNQDAPMPPQYRLRNAVRLGYTRPTDPMNPVPIVPPGNYRFNYGRLPRLGYVNDMLGSAAAPVIPGAPGLGAVYSSQAAGILVYWGAVSGATSYNLYRTTGSGAPLGLPIYQGPYTAFVDVTTSGTYYYRVTAVNAAGEGAVSNQGTATIP